MEEKKVFLKMIVGLEKHKIPYMITGSVASILYGEPRLTNDIDVIVALKKQDVPLLREGFPVEEFYVPPEEAISEEIDRKGQFNIIHIPTAIKMDCIILKDTEFDLEQFKHRKKIPFIGNKKAYTSSPESVILNKILFYKQGGSEKHISDIIGMLKVSIDTIDMDYIKNWAKDLKVDDIWNMILERIKSETIT